MTDVSILNSDCWAECADCGTVYPVIADVTWEEPILTIGREGGPMCPANEDHDFVENIFAVDE